MPSLNIVGIPQRFRFMVPLGSFGIDVPASTTFSSL